MKIVIDVVEVVFEVELEFEFVFEVEFEVVAVKEVNVAFHIMVIG